MLFIDAFAGWPGSANDAIIWSESLLKKKIDDDSLFIPQNMHLLGDCAYPLKPYLMVPYKDDSFLIEKEKNLILF